MADIREIYDLSRPELEIFSDRSEVRLYRYFEPEPGLFMAESAKVIARALDAGYEPFAMLAERKLLADGAAGLPERCGGIPVYTADAAALTEIAGYRLTQGILCAMRGRPRPTPEEVCRGASRVAVLEEITNPTNIGAVFRSAAALNFDAVLLTPGCCDPLYRRSIRVSMGTVFQIPWTYLEAEEYVSFLKRMGFASAAMALSEDSVSLEDPGLAAEEKLAVILGNEGHGLRASTIAACDYTVKIPMSHGVDSLNVAAASAVAFWQLGRGKNSGAEQERIL